MTDKNNDVNHTPPHKSFPSIKSLFVESWYVFKKSLFQLFILNVLSSLIMYFFLFLIYGNSFFNSSYIDPQVVPNWSIVFFGFIFMLVSALYFSISTIVAIDNSGQKRLSDIFKISFKLILPLLAASFLMGIIIIGGSFLFIIPAILFSFYFVFSWYEVIINNQRWTHALKHSYAIVHKHFWRILIRILIMLPIIIFPFVPPSISEKMIDKNIYWSSYIVNFIYNTVFGSFSTIYCVVLYKQAKSINKNEEEKSIRWIIITSSIGWIILLLISSIGMWAINSKAYLLPQDFKVYVGNNNTVLSHPAPGFKERIIPTYNYYTGTDGGYIAVLSYQKEGAAYSIGGGIYIVGQVRFKGKYINRIFYPDGYQEGADFTRDPKIIEVCEKYFPDFANKIWVVGDSIKRY